MQAQRDARLSVFRFDTGSRSPAIRARAISLRPNERGDVMAIQLETGAYFGHCGRAFSCPQGLLTEVAHACGRHLPEHRHQHSYISLLIGGSYTEHIEGEEFRYRPMDAVFHPFGALHSDTVGPGGGRFLCLEVLQEDVTRELATDCGQPRRLQPDTTVLMLRLHRHLRLGTLSPEMLESSLYELLGTVEPWNPKREARFPRWLRDCLDYIDAHYQTPITVGELARRVGLHPVHLAREFRRRFNETLGEYVNTVRVKSACSQIISHAGTLADVAMASGFYDHSHFVRVFKARIGCTPSTFRDHHAHH